MTRDRITVDDVRRAGFCARGMAGWLAGQGWDKAKIRAFLKDGIDVDDVTELQDDALFKHVMKMRGKDGRRR